MNEGQPKQTEREGDRQLHNGRSEGGKELFLYLSFGNTDLQPLFTLMNGKRGDHLSHAELSRAKGRIKMSSTEEEF